MKNILTILLIVFASKTFSQSDSTKAKFEGNCIQTSGSITVNDFGKLKRICPPKLTKVIRYKYIYQPKGKTRKNSYPVYFESNDLDFKMGHKPVKPGDIIIFEDIVGLGADKKRSAADAIVLTIK